MLGIEAPTVGIELDVGVLEYDERGVELEPADEALNDSFKFIATGVSVGTVVIFDFVGKGDIRNYFSRRVVRRLW